MVLARSGWRPSESPRPFGRPRPLLHHDGELVGVGVPDHAGLLGRPARGVAGDHVKSGPSCCSSSAVLSSCMVLIVGVGPQHAVILSLIIGCSNRLASFGSKPTSGGRAHISWLVGLIISRGHTGPDNIRLRQAALSNAA